MGHPAVCEGILRYQASTGYHVPMMPTKTLLPAALLFITLAQLTAQTAASPTLHGDQAHPGHAARWVDTRLYFGLGPSDALDKGVSEAAWRDFLDKEVTPRFPSGLSVMDVYGQWQGKQQAAEAKPPSRERSKMLVIDYPATAENAAKIEAIRTAWKERTHAQSVLKVTQPADVSF
jgi:hypothetical protein